MTKAKYPKKVTFQGVEYQVSADFNTSGEIQYFNLYDKTGEFFFEMDYEAGSLTEEDIIQIVSDELAYETEEQEPVRIREDAASIADNIENAYYEELFATRYSQYAELGDEFRVEAIDVLRRNSNESKMYQDVLLDELSELYEE